MPAEGGDDRFVRGELGNLLVGEHHPELAFELGNQHQVVQGAPVSGRFRRKICVDVARGQVQDLCEHLTNAVTDGR